MRVTATCSFGGEISMTKGETREIQDGDVLRSLLHAGYVVDVKPPQSLRDSSPDKPGEPENAASAPKHAAKKKSNAKKATA